MLEKALTAAVRGDVRFDAQTKALYATDASNYRQVPIGVVFPKDEGDVKAALTQCRTYNAPLLSRGAGTSLAGQGCNEAVILDFSKHMNRILSINAAARQAVVEPGVILDHLRHQAEKYSLTFGPDPATHSRCTLGGMIGNNSCGVHAVAWGKTVDNVEALKVLTYDGTTLEVGRTTPEHLASIIRQGGRRGEIYAKLEALRDKYIDLIRARFPKIPRRVSGYNLDELLPENEFNVARALVGTEGTCVSVLQATLRLIPSPPVRRLVVLGFPSVYAAADAVPALLESQPIGLEGMDRDLVSNIGRYQGFPEKIQLLPTGEAWLLLEFGAQTFEEADTKAKAVIQGRPHRLATADQAIALWSIRESVLAATAFVPGKRDRHEGWEDSAVAPEKLGAYLRELRVLYDRYEYKGAFYGHFGDGCLHTRIDFDLSSASGRQATRKFLDEAADLVVRYGGSLSGEHGDGQARGELLPKMYGPELMEAFREFKRIWDPGNRMNPGKLIEPYGILENLRVGENVHPETPKTHFHYPKQESSFFRAVLRCVGVGKCRNEEGGMMCPSYQVTRDEAHSTRGRARLLFEMLRGETITGGWKSKEVKDALDLCLSCKACKNECPTNVDMASWKAEFLSHYYEGRLRPLKAYLYGYINRWLRLGSKAPRLANLFSPGPKLAPQTLHHLCLKPELDPIFKQIASKSDLKQAVKPVVLWADTFTNYLSPQVGVAAVHVLSHAGHSVRLSPPGLCCGRPLYDHGFLDEAKRYLRRILDSMKPEIEAGIPIIVLEPGCASVFKDELLNLFPNDWLAAKLSEQVVLFSQFIPATPPRQSHAGVPTKMILQTHCHEKSVLNPKAEPALLQSLGYDVALPESGCCGMAGAFGLEHDALSKALGERALAPAVRETTGPILADGFSCREQIRRLTGKDAQHLAQVLYSHLSQNR